MKYILSFFLLLICSFTDMTYASDLKESRIVEIKDKIESCKDANEKLSLINELLNTDFKASSHTYWFKRQVELADSINDYKSKIKACANLSRVYFNIEKIDSLIYWSKVVACESRKHNWYDYYFETHLFECMWYVRSRNFSIATKKVRTLKAKADSTNSNAGKVACEQILGLINLQTQNTDAAMLHFENAIKLYDLNPTRQSLKCQLYLYLLMCNDNRTDYDKQLSVLNRFTGFIDDENKKTNPGFAISKALWYNKYYRFSFHTKYGNKDSAAYYLNIIDKLDIQSYNRNKFLKTKSQFLTLCGRYNEAIATIDNIIDPETPNNEEFIRLKAFILNKMGRNKDAYETYLMAFKELKNNRDSILANELRVIQEKNELFQLQSQSRDLIFKTQRFKNLSTLIVLVLLTILFVIVTTMRVYDRRYRLSLVKSSHELKNEKYKLEETMANLRQMLDKANESNSKKDEFLSNMSHEIRTPLNSVVGFSEMIAKESSPTSDIYNYTEVIRNNSELLLKLVSEIVDASRVESENIILELDDADVIKCANESVKSIAQLINKKVKISFTSELEELIINTDILRIRQILINLLGNAAKFTKEGEINLSVYIADNKLYFAVSDTGPGIPVEKADEIFNRFEKLDEVAGGTGLGLFICKTLAQKLKGRVYIDTEYINGARFIFEHPL